MAAAFACVIGVVIGSSPSGSHVSGVGEGTISHPEPLIHESLDALWGPAPTWPFRGVVAYEGPDGSYRSSIKHSPAVTDGAFGLGIYDLDTGQIGYVRTPASSSLCGGGSMFINDDGIRWNYGEYGTNREWIVFVPWGDYAYPQFRDPRSPHGWPWDQYRWHSYRYNRAAFGSGLADIDLSIAGHEWIGLATRRESRYYQVTSGPVDDVNVTAYGATLPGSVPDDFFEHERLSPEDHFSLLFAGTDGERYGISIEPYEPACGGNLTYIIDAEDGGLVTCGWSWIGPLLVAPSSSVTEAFTPALPELTMSINHDETCSQVLKVRNWKSYLRLSDG